MDSSDYYIPAVALWIGLAVKLPGLVRGWRDPLVRTVGLVIAVGGAGFFFAAPPTIAAVNRASGVANFSSPLVYSIISGFSASCLLLIVHWRGGPPAHVARVSRRWQAAYLLVTAALVALFALGDAPVDRLTDFDTYYATTPFIGEMIVLYLLAHMTAALVTTVMCWRWALHVQGWLRAGLWILVVGWLLNLAFSGLKLVAVVARWTGRDWSALSTDLAPLLSALSAPCATVGFLLPLVGPWLVSTRRAMRTYRRLGPLWRELGAASPRLPLAAPIPWHSPPYVRLTRREAGIQDGLSLVGPCLDDAVRTRARDAAEATGHTAAEAGHIGHAAMITAAVAATRGGTTPRPATVPGHARIEALRGTLPAVSDALRTSAIVAAVREATAGAATEAATEAAAEATPKSPTAPSTTPTSAPTAEPTSDRDPRSPQGSPGSAKRAAPPARHASRTAPSASPRHASSVTPASPANHTSRTPPTSPVEDGEKSST
ncbi:MAB_1171c family putative transporter [Streptomyces sp. NPDC091292]|uniref:MAB_1171c family putative transporter n=1 Tax=Streptomyces sp. NPDC091292 TaxID=3365991 RepID=UPI0038106DD6